MSATKMTIGDVSRHTGVGVETVRFYERKGLVRRPPKPKEGYRIYPMQVVAEIAFIRQAQGLGFSLREVAELMALRAEAGTDCGTVRHQCETKLQGVRTKILKLHRIEAALKTLIAACPGRGALVDCSIMDALAEPVPLAQQPKGHSMESIDLRIEGLRCENCVNRLTGVLSRLPGVEKVKVSLKNGTARIVYDPSAASPQALNGLIEDAGFSVPAS